MDLPDAAPAAQRRSPRLQFDRYVLDLDRGCLSLTRTRLPYGQRPSRSCIIFVENSGRLVSKDELFAAVWPDLAVTDDALVQSIGELRRALGDDGPRLIRTVPRRGYRFESDVSRLLHTWSVFNRCGTDSVRLARSGSQSSGASHCREALP